MSRQIQKISMLRPFKQAFLKWEGYTQLLLLMQELSLDDLPKNGSCIKVLTYGA